MIAEQSLLTAMEPMIDDLVALEKSNTKTVARLAEFEQRLDASIAAAKSGASEEARAAIDEAVVPLKEDLRATFADAIREVKSITEEAIATATRQAASISNSIESREKTAVAILLTEAQRYGA